MWIKISDNNVKLWLSARETRRWANGESLRRTIWPCSELSGRRLYAEFDAHGLVDFRINGRLANIGAGAEFNAITSDFLRPKLPKDHACYSVTVGQFEKKEERKAANTVKITVQGGMVQDVAGLPDGWQYEVEDLDHS